MNSEITVLVTMAASIGFFHTLLGPDHYLPFIVMSRAGKWSLLKTAMITLLCGVGHVLSSAVLGLIGIALGMMVFKLETAEGFRGNLASWLLIGFGLAYFVWGIHKAIKDRTHKHVHTHGVADSHAHEHSHASDHSHVHDTDGKSMTPWVLFIIFVLGPCEPLIPALMYPAAKHSTFGVILVAAVFCSVTIVTMLSIVMLGAWGISFTRLGRLERYAHAFAGAAVCLSGLAIQFLGL